MNRVDRLFAILLRLQSAGRLRAEDLAAAFEVSRRTIYRDIRALAESGVPIVSLPGEGYELVEGFYLPPLLFTENEAVALFLGARFLIQQAKGALPVAAERAIEKISVVLPKELRQRVSSLTDIIAFFAPSEPLDLDAPQLTRLQHAIRNHQVVHLRYHSLSNDEITDRDIEPYRLHYSEGVWYVEGYCRLRQDIRSFRLSRVIDLKTRKEAFQDRHQAKAVGTFVEVKVRFAQSIVRWVRERQHYAFVGEESLPSSESVLMTYNLSRITEILPWVLSWGASAEVLSPPELRARIRLEVNKLAQTLT